MKQGECWFVLLPGEAVVVKFGVVVIVIVVGIIVCVDGLALVEAERK